MEKELNNNFNSKCSCPDCNGEIIVTREEVEKGLLNIVHTVVK